VLASNVKNTSDLMSIALQAEREAIRRYSHLMKAMREANNESAAALFERMVAEEQEHERLLEEWMQQEKIKENPDIAAVRWSDPNISTVYNDEAKDPYQSSPYRALAFAVHNEEIAFRFYTHVAAESDNKEVRKYAEILAREELGHAALLRAERRRAYHKERESGEVEPAFDTSLIHSETDLLTVALFVDRVLLDLMQDMTEEMPPLKAMFSNTEQEFNRNEKKLGDNYSASEDTLAMLEQLKSYNTYLKEKIKHPEPEMTRLWTCCDRSFAFYDSIVESATDEDVMLAAQQLTVSALDRIAALKQVIALNES